MEEDSWSFGLSSASSRSYQSTLKSPHPDFLIEIDDFDGDEDLRLDFPCPFCSEDFDLLGLCCHVDEEHPSETKSGVCPVCATKIGTNMVDHITTQHANFFKGHQKLKPQKDEFFKLSLTRKDEFLNLSLKAHQKLKPQKDEFLNLSLTRKELQDEHFRSIFGGSSVVSPVSTSSMALDPLLSFLHSASINKSNDLKLPSSSDPSLDEELDSSEPKVLESDNRSPPLSDKDQEEKAQRCRFVQGLVLSTIFEDDL